MIDIKKEYGMYYIADADGTKYQFKNIDELSKHIESKQNTYFQETTQASIYVSDEESILEASDLIIAATMATWGNTLYSGDCIKLTITAEYCPEDK